jgi:hypothetical protein
MLRNFKINQILWAAALLIGTMLLFNTLLAYKNLSYSKDLIDEKQQEILPHAFSFMQLKLDVIQVQQWLTDLCYKSCGRV